MLRAKILKSNKGFTLIEIVASVTILGIIAVAFFGIFTNGYTTVFTIGTKNNEMAIVESKMELLYTVDDVGQLNLTTLENLLGPTNLITNYTDLYVNPADGRIRFYSTQTIPVAGGDGYTVTIAVIYPNGKDYMNISLTSFFKKKGVA